MTLRIDAADLTPRNIALHACGLLSTIAAVWSFVAVVPFLGSLEVARHRRGYRPATFVVDRVVYRHANPLDEDAIDRFWAEGTVDGRAERLSLGGSLAREPRSLEELEALVKPGQRFAVLYNSAVTDVMAQTRYLRVLPYEPDFARSQKRALLLVALPAYGPLSLALLAGVVLWSGAERKHRRLALLWAGFDAMALGVQAAGAVLFLTVPALARVIR